MPDWLAADFVSSTPVAISDLVVRLGASVLGGAAVAAIYRLSHGRSKADRSVLTTTLVLLSILIALVSLVIGDSVARAFSLVGALSIVRFRTVVEDTRDTAFVIFAVIVGMGTGTGLFAVPAIGIPIVGGVAIGMSRMSGSLRMPGSLASLAPLKESALDLRIGLGRDPEAILDPVFARHSVERRLTSIATARQGAAIDVSYRIALKTAEDASAFVAALNQVEGVQSVALRLASPESDLVSPR